MEFDGSFNVPWPTAGPGREKFTSKIKQDGSFNFNCNRFEFRINLDE